MRISFVSDAGADQLLALRPNEYRYTCGLRVPPRLMKEINGIRQEQGVFILASISPVGADRISREITRFYGHRNSVEASLSSRHLESYVNSRWRNDPGRFIDIGLCTALAVGRAILKIDATQTVKCYISGGKMESGDWYHTFRFHVVRNTEDDWQDHAEFMGSDSVSASEVDSYYVVLFAGG